MFYWSEPWFEIMGFFVVVVLFFCVYVLVWISIFL